VTWLKHILSRK